MSNQFKRHIVSIVSITVAVLSLLFAFTAWAATGTTDSPDVPGSTKSYTLEDIYDRINDGATAISTTFTEPSSGPGTGTMHTLNDIYDLIGERAQVPKTGQTALYRTGDDGDLKKGVAWPSPRFTGNGTGVITDTLTGLMWAENANLPSGKKSRNDAIDYCNGLSLGGHTDWRLPNVRELHSLIDFSQYVPALPSGHPFDGVQSGNYWSSTTYAGTTNDAWYVYLRDGYVDSGYEGSSYYVWPVRGGQ